MSFSRPYQKDTRPYFLALFFLVALVLLLENLASYNKALIAIDRLQTLSGTVERFERFLTGRSKQKTAKFWIQGQAFEYTFKRNKLEEDAWYDLRLNQSITIQYDLNHPWLFWKNQHIVWGLTVNGVKLQQVDDILSAQRDVRLSSLYGGGFSLVLLLVAGFLWIHISNKK